MIIGIGGVSTAGKTTLSAQLRDFYTEQKCITLCQDDFVKPLEQIPLINNRINWEHPDSIDHDRFREAIREAGRNYDIVIAEGLLVFHDKTTRKLLEKRLCVEIDFTTFRKRKAVDKRWGYEPPWYIQHIWDSFLEYGSIPDDGAEYLILDGRLPFNLEIINSYLKR